MNHHKRILELCYYSNGAISISEAYNLPIPYRHFYIKLMNDIKQEEADMMKQKTTQKTSNSGTMASSYQQRSNQFGYLDQIKKK